MFQIRRFFNRSLIIALMCIPTLFVSNATGQKQAAYVVNSDVKIMLFRESNKLLKIARSAQAEVLSPENYDNAMKRYQEAEADFKEGKNLEDIQKKLSESNAYFQKAIISTKLAEVTFPNAMKARKDAQNTGSARFSSKLWTEAEKKFKDAANELEDGDVKDAREIAGEAEKLYRQAELEAIKANYLDETRGLLKQADQLDVDDYAPKTLKLSQQLVKQAEKELNENRYDTDMARSLAQQANYQAKHAIYLAKAIKQIKDNDQSWEDLMLVSERPLQQIAYEANLDVSFETGLGTATNEIIEYIATNQINLAVLNQNMDFNEHELYLQNRRIVELEQQLGSQAEEKSELAQQIRMQKKTVELFTNIERSFKSTEARVLREGNDIIIRLVGLNFPSAQATIEQKSFGLLTKVRDAINDFPGCTVSVLGYTDSYGGDAQNLELSKDRAEAVKQYLLANSKLAAAQIEAIGYGEIKPIASNDSEGGRATNRRVEVVIHPAMTMRMLSDGSSL